MTRMPAGSSSVRLASREQLRTATSAAVQPPSDWPDQVHLVEPEPVEEIEVVHGQVADVAHPGRIVGGAVARVLGHPITSHFCGEQLEERQPWRQAVGAVQEHQRRTGAAPQHPDADVPDLVFRFRSRHGLALPATGVAIYKPETALQSAAREAAMAAVDTERFRLRRFVERLVQLGECEIHDKPIDLIDVAAVLDGNPRATWFKAVGPEKAELIGNVMGSRKRLALALDTDEAGLLPEIMQSGSPIRRSR